MVGFPRIAEQYDFVIVGGGHAGLQAALKAALLHHTALLVDRGPKFSRSYYSPRMDNIPGFPDGISGHKLLDLQITQVRAHDDRITYVTPSEVTKAERVDGGFRIDFDWLKQPKSVRGRALILAMGVVDRMPEIGGAIDAIFPWANFALVDFCILCDGHDLTGKSVAVLGHDAYAAELALEILHYEPKSVEILTSGHPLLAGSDPDRRTALTAELATHHISSFEPAITAYDGIKERTFVVRFADGSSRQYDRGFSGLGWYERNTRLPLALGARLDPEGYVAVDDDSQALSAETGTSIPHLYVVGDLKSGWNQIPEAWASAERAVIHAYADFL
ncbi:MAG: FAD-dependent oxidoreductase [Thermoplasmata archaeon]|nr:FAD-dependent oxidoreductase [Thermoplasmata archaeon]